MPILSLTPTNDNNNSNNNDSNDNILAELEKTNCCSTSCKHTKALKQEDSLIPTPINFNKPKKTSLVSRNEDDNWVDISDKRLRNSRLGALYDGSRFKGVQKCGTSKYNVLVDIKVKKIKRCSMYIFLTVLPFNI